MQYAYISAISTSKQGKETKTMTAQAKYNLSVIMTEAHKAAKSCLTMSVYAGWTYAQILSVHMKRLWVDERGRVDAARRAAQSEVDRLRAAISDLENKDHWTPRDYQERDRLSAALKAATAHEEAAPTYAQKRDLIAAAGGRIVSVTFTKADGSERVMKVQPATLKTRTKGEAASDAGKRAVATRKARHPNLLPVWDVEKGAPRSINLATVSRIATGGQVHTFVA